MNVTIPKSLEDLVRQKVEDRRLVKRLDLTEIAREDLRSIRRYSQKAWGPGRTARYMAELREVMKGLTAGIRDVQAITPNKWVLAQKEAVQI